MMQSFVQSGGITEQLLSSLEFEEKLCIASIADSTIPVYSVCMGLLGKVDKDS